MSSLFYLCSSQVEGQIRTVCWEIEWGKRRRGWMESGQEEEEGSREVVLAHATGVDRHSQEGV